MLLFNDPATTESYTYLHTLALHDARPIYLVGSATAFAGGSVSLSATSQTLVFFAAGDAACAGPALTSVPSPAASTSVGLRFRDTAVGRSEEHTSELQSLMRISYAVFCLKNKTI